MAFNPVLPSRVPLGALAVAGAALVSVPLAVSTAGPQPVAAVHAGVPAASMPASPLSAGPAAPGGPAGPAGSAGSTGTAEVAGLTDTKVRHDWPTGAPARVVAPFAPPAARWQAGHRGVDLEANLGGTVLASGDGVIAFRGVVAGRPVISIDHPDGTRTSYEPVESGLTVGESVRRGSPIGVLVADARDAVPGEVHAPGVLHWGARIPAARAGSSASGGSKGGWVYIDPLSLLGAQTIRLLPIAAGEN